MQRQQQAQAADDPARILVVDDVPANVRLLATYLGSEGYEVHTASSGKGALEQIRRAEIDLVLLDIMMPELNGFETCRAIKEDAENRHIPVILVTALSEVQDKQLGQSAGADDFISKPFDRVELLLRVRSMLRLKSTHDQLAAKVAELEAAKEELSELANTDGLTTLHNKRYLEEFLEREIDRAQRYRRPLSLLMLDLDRFKSFNDSLGHQGGDVLLQQVSRRILDCIRSIDLAARYGGEEFVLVLLETGSAGARALAETLRQNVSDREFRDGKGRAVRDVTVSIGVATFPEDGTIPAALIEAADRRLYLAKRRGRNRVVCGDA